MAEKKSGTSSKSTTAKKTAPKKTEAKKTETKTSTSQKSSSKKTFWGLNKISFYTIGAVAILYLISAILAVCGVSLKVISVLQGVATAILICITAFLAWKYVRQKQTVYKVLYFVLLLVVILGIILPLVV